MDTNRITKIVKIVSSLATVFLFLLVAIIVGQYIKINSLNNSLEDINTEISSLEESRYSFESGIEQRQTSTYIETYARSELGLLDDNEVYFEFE